MQSPAAYRPGTVVCIFSSTTMRFPSTAAPSFRASAVLPATPSATNTPDTSCTAPPASCTPVTRCSPRDGFHLLGADATSGGNSAGQGRAVRQQGDASYHRQKRLHLMQGVLAVAQHRHVLSAVEKGIAGGALADAVAFQPGQPRDAAAQARRGGGRRGIGGGSARWLNDRVCRVIARPAFPRSNGRSKSAPRPRRCTNCTPSRRAFDARRSSSGPETGWSKAGNKFRFGSARASAPEPLVSTVVRTPARTAYKCSGHPRRAGTYDNNVGHGVAPCMVLCPYYTPKPRKISVTGSQKLF